MKLDMKEVVKPAAILFIICLITTALLAGTNLLTMDQVAAQEEKTASEARKAVLPAATDFEEATADVDGETISYFIGKANGETAGYVFTTAAHSYGGELKTMTGIDNSGAITGVQLISINDTPGLGMNAQKEDFRTQYLQAAPESGFSVIKSGAPKDGEISAMTGATITSKAVTDAVNQAVTQYQNVKGGE